MRSFAALYLGIGMFLAGCYTAEATPVSTGRPTQLAKSWLAEGNARLGKHLPLKVQTEVPFKGGDGAPLFYAVQLAPQGLIIVSADDLIEPVIAFSDSGTTSSLTPGNPLMEMLGVDLPDRIIEARAAGADYLAGQQNPSIQAIPNPRLNRANVNKAQWEKYSPSTGKTTSPQVASSTTTASDTYGSPASISDIRIAPMLQSTWNQATAQGVACYNYYCPPYGAGNANNYLAGCVATTLGQLLRYWQYPVSGIGQVAANIDYDGGTHSATTLGGDGMGGPYDWSNMPLTPGQGALSATQCQAIGRLITDCGTLVNMSYASAAAGGSTASLLTARNALISTFGYSNARYRYITGGLSKSERNTILFSNLSAGYPVITGIRNSSNGNGHAVITDGFGYISSSAYFHVNYGWGGASDAWYNLPNLDSSPAYDIVDLLIFNVFTNGTGEIIAGRLMDSYGNPIEEATVTATSANTNFTVTSDANGYYGVRVPGGNTYTLTAIKPGYSAPPLSNIIVSAPASYWDTNANFWGADITLTADSAAIPTLGEWGLIALTAMVAAKGSQLIHNKQLTTYSCNHEQG